MPQLHVHRERRPWMDRARKYRVMVDGQEAGRVANGDSGSFEVAPGRHEVHMKIDWTRSRKLEVDVPEQGEVHLTCAANANPFTVLWYISFGLRNYVRLDEGQPAALTA